MKLFSILLIFFLTSFAKTKENRAHREHGVHAHGAGTLGIAFEGTSGRIDLKITSESIVGFEYAPKSAKDKKKRDTALLTLEKNISEMIVFDPSLNCRISKEKIEIVAESEKHSNLVAGFGVACGKSPVGTEIVLNFQKQFPNIKDLDVEVVADNIQKSVEAKKNSTRLLLK